MGIVVAKVKALRVIRYLLWRITIDLYRSWHCQKTHVLQPSLFRGGVDQGTDGLSMQLLSRLTNSGKQGSTVISVRGGPIKDIQVRTLHSDSYSQQCITPASGAQSAHLSRKSGRSR